MEREYMLVNRILLFRFWAGETKSEREGGAAKGPFQLFLLSTHFIVLPKTNVAYKTLNKAAAIFAVYISSVSNKRIYL